jgi:BASS family bile acid:Na+ symporter
MFRLNDLILILVIFSSMFAGILFPEQVSFLQPIPLYLMMLLLFLSFLTVEMTSVWGLLKSHGPTVIWLSFLKMFLIPTLVYFIFKEFYPPYAIGALLLTGISTGVVAPFISGLVNANGSLVLVMVVISSLIVPFSLPFLVKLLAARDVAIPLSKMTQMLSLVIFVPAIAAEALRRLSPSILNKLIAIRYPVTLVIFAVVNLAVFSKYADFFRQNPATILEATSISVILGAVYVIIGILTQARSTLKNQLAAAISFANINNVLVIVFASEFFGHLEPTLAATYMIPFFALILPLRIFQRIRSGKTPRSPL